MATWDYRVIQLKEDPSKGGDLKKVNDLGADEWEAFGVTEDNTGWWVFLKRPSRGASKGDGGRGRRRRSNGSSRRSDGAAS